jgi:hypothetical protein
VRGVVIEVLPASVATDRGQPRTEDYHQNGYENHPTYDYLCRKQALKLCLMWNHGLVVRQDTSGACAEFSPLRLAEPHRTCRPLVKGCEGNLLREENTGHLLREGGVRRAGRILREGTISSLGGLLLQLEGRRRYTNLFSDYDSNLLNVDIRISYPITNTTTPLYSNKTVLRQWRL